MLTGTCPTTPHTPRHPNPKRVFGKVAQDDYRWLEKDTPKREAWLQDQMTRTDCHLDSYPEHGQIKERLMEAFSAQNTAYTGEMLKAEGYELQWTREAGSQFTKLSRFTEGATEGEVVFDPSTWPTGETLGWTKLSPDRKYLAYGRVLNGMDAGRMEIMELSSGEVVSTLDGADAMDAPAWAGKDDKLYFSAKRGRSGFLSLDVSDNRVVQVARDWLAPYGDVAEHDGAVLFTTNAPTYLEEKAVFLNAQGERKGTNIPIGRMDFSSKGTNVFIQTTADAPNGKVLVIDMKESQSGEAPEPKLLIPETPGRKITGVTALENAVAVSYSDKAMPGIAVYNLEGEVLHQIPIGEPGALSGMRADDEGNLRFNWSTLARPSETRKFDVSSGEMTVLKQQVIPNFNPDDYKVEQHWYKSEDGTNVPMTVAYDKDLELNGENPAHIYVYGGFNSAVEPGFSATRIPFLEKGGVYAIAHVRGGDDLGEEWHDQATGLNRTKVYDDVAGAARHLAKVGLSSADHTSIEGASNGGLVAGVAITRNPELFDAAISEVGLHDMVRYEALGGSSWNQEYGTIHDKEEAMGLLSWSPYHNIIEGVDYPAVMVTTGKHDDRVDPAHSFKFAAKMQEVETPQSPVYLRVEENLGHGHGATDEHWADRYADQWAFLLSELRDDDAA